eukprot:scaffold30365_cov23-Tisochrysis_lutea.AAC.3
MVAMMPQVHDTLVCMSGKAGSCTLHACSNNCCGAVRCAACLVLRALRCRSDVVLPSGLVLDLTEFCRPRRVLGFPGPQLVGSCNVLCPGKL